ncbi:hypothetical protein KC345_g1591 [Hortaea werneckii]|nr:hypothetical protein KC345_g1591 [Hortaea werneckii]
MQHSHHHHPTNPTNTLSHKRLLIPLWTTSLAFTLTLFALGITHTLDIENVLAQKYPRDWSYETQNLFAGSATACGVVTLALDVTSIVLFGSPKYVLRPEFYGVFEGLKVFLWGYYFVLTCVFHGGPNLWADYFLSIILVVVGGCGVGYAWTVGRKGRRRVVSERRAWDAERVARASSRVKEEEEEMGDVVKKPEAVKREYEMRRLA